MGNTARGRYYDKSQICYIYAEVRLNFNGSCAAECAPPQTHILWTAEEVG